MLVAHSVLIGFWDLQRQGIEQQDAVTKGRVSLYSSFEKILIEGYLRNIP